MSNAYVCLAKVTKVSHEFCPEGVCQTVTLNTSARLGDGNGRHWSGMTLPVPYYRTLTGRDPVVGDVVKIVTTDGVWP